MCSFLRGQAPFETQILSVSQAPDETGNKDYYLEKRGVAILRAGYAKPVVLMAQYPQLFAAINRRIFTRPQERLTLSL